MLLQRISYVLAFFAIIISFLSVSWGSSNGWIKCTVGDEIIETECSNPDPDTAECYLTWDFYWDPWPGEKVEYVCDCSLCGGSWDILLCDNGGGGGGGGHGGGPEELNIVKK